MVSETVAHVLLTGFRRLCYALFIILILLLSLQSLLSDSVQISLPRLRDSPASLVFVLLQDTDLLQRLHDLAIHGPAGIDVMGGTGASILLRAVEFPKTADTDSLSEVNVSCDGGGTDVIPIEPALAISTHMIAELQILPIHLLWWKLL